MTLAGTLDAAWQLAQARDRLNIAAILRQHQQLCEPQFDEALTMEIQARAAAGDMAWAYTALAVRTFLADYCRTRDLDEALDQAGALPLTEASPLLGLRHRISDYG